MADFFLIAELIKYFSLDNSTLMIHNSFTYKTKVRTDSVLDSYFTTLYGATDDTGKETLNIKGCIVDSDNFYSVQTSIADCEDNEESIYFDIPNQMFYIHLNHSLNPYNCSIEYGKVYGYSNDKVRDFNGIDYLPLLKSVPNLQLKVDPLKYSRQAFYAGTFIFNNQPVDGTNNGTFDSNEEFTGNDIFLLFGEDEDAYTDLLLIANNYVKNTIPSLDEVKVITQDKREQQSKNAPLDTFTLAEFPDIDPDIIGDIKPDAYNAPPAVPGICIDTEQLGTKTFYFASIIKAVVPVPVFFKMEDEKLMTIVPSATDYPNGMVTFAVADIHVDGDNTKGIFDVICNGIFIDLQNPADIIADLNDTYLNIVYNASNYNTVEWADEKQYLQDVSLYMNDEKEIFEWIEIIQNGSDVGFQYLFEDNKRTIRLDNPNRTPEVTIQAVEILNNDTLEFNNNEDMYATHAVVKYNKDNYTDKYLRYQNDDYYEEVFQQHRKDSQFETESLLNDEITADDKSVILMEDLQKERPTGIITLHGKSFFELKIFNIITAEISYPGFKTGHEEVDVFIKTRDGVNTYIKTRDTGLDLYTKVRYTYRDIIEGYREYLGTLRFQIIGIYPDFETGNVNLEIRQRDYSTLFDSITGYTP